MTELNRGKRMGQNDENSEGGSTAQKCSCQKSDNLTDSNHESDTDGRSAQTISQTYNLVDHGDILKDGLGNEYRVLIDQQGHAELRRLIYERAVRSRGDV